MNERSKNLIKHFSRAPEILRCVSQTSSWATLTSRYVGLQTGFPFVAKFRDGTTFKFEDLPDLATWWQIFCRKIYPVRADDRIIIDAGANVGAFTLYALQQARQAKVIAIEPFPATFARLRDAVDRSPFRARVDLLNIALASRSGIVTMQEGPMASQFRSVLDEGPEQRGTVVDSCPLTEILARAEGKVDLLKMDIEGSEYASLLSSPPESLRRIRRIAMEFHPTVDALGSTQRQDLFRHLEQAGLKATEVQDHGGGYGMAYFTAS